MENQEVKNKFESGDVVHLNSAPEVKMTVEEFVGSGDKGIVHVVYFDMNNVLGRTALQAELITKV